MLSTREEQYFDALSISSLGSDGMQEQSMAGSIQTVELYQRLQDLDELTAKFLGNKRVTLQNDYDSFSDIEINSSQDFELKVSNNFSSNDILTLSVMCIPDCMNDDTDFWIDENARPLVKHHDLELVLKKKRNFNSTHERNSILDFQYTLHNGEYSYTLTSADGMTPGIYILTVKNVAGDLRLKSGAHLQPVRVSYKNFPAVRATPIANGKPLVDRSQGNEFKFYRFVCQEKQKMIRITVKITKTENLDNFRSSECMDMYVTNAYHGLVAVGKENCVWKSGSSSVCNIDIHPTDKQFSRGGIFVIGVTGSKEFNEFEIIASIITPNTITPISLGNGKINCHVFDGNYRFFSVKIDPRQRGKIVINMGTENGTDGYGGKNDFDTENDRFSYSKLQNYGRGVYTNDELPAAGVNLKINEKEDNDYFSHSITLPPSLPQTVGLFPIIFLSSNSMYPTAEEYTWRASGIDGMSRIVIEMDEWKYTGGVLYLSVYGLEVHSQLQQAKNVHTYDAHSTGVNSRELDGGKDKSKTGQNKGNNSSGKENEKQNQNQKENENAIIPYGKKDIKCYIDAYICDESNEMDRGSKARYELFMECYSNVDAVGFLIREKEKEKNAEKEKEKNKNKEKEKQNEKDKDKEREKDIEKEKEKEKERERERERDRGSSANTEDSAMCYGEVEYISFQELLLDVGATDGQIFFDLSCGSGKALASAALSGIRFTRCVGAEMSPASHGCATSVLNEIKRCMSSQHTHNTHINNHNNNNINNNNNNNYENENDNESRGKRRSNSFNNSTANKNSNFGNIKQGQKTYGLNNSTSHQEGTYAPVRTCSNNILQLAVQSLPSGLPLLEVRAGDYTTEDWSDSDLVFFGLPLCSDIQLSNILKIGKNLKKGAKVLSLKQPNSDIMRSMKEITMKDENTVFSPPTLSSDSPENFERGTALIANGFFLVSSVVAQLCFGIRNF